MRRLCLLVSVALLALVGCGTNDEIKPAQTVAREWWLSGVSKDGRALFIGYDDGCGAHAPRAKTWETAASIRIEVRSAPPDGHVPCPMQNRASELTVPLKRPINGRRVLGEPEHADGQVFNITMPRVSGLSLRDAAGMFQSHPSFMTLRVTGDLSSPVSEQRPAPGTNLILSARKHHRQVVVRLLAG